VNEEGLVGISDACQILNVSETALRQWTDEGKIKAFVTPGGHRRYAVADLKKFMSSPLKVVGIRDLVVELEDAANSLRDTAMTSLHGKEWYARLEPEARHRLAGLGRSMLQVIIKYANEPGRRDETIGLARDVGQDFGRTLATLGLPLTDSVEAFLLHRDPILNAATHLMKKGTLTGRFVEAIPLMAQVMDEALVSLVAAHQQQRATAVSTTRKPPPKARRHQPS
jgi:excisionase family DNA binding protein